MKRIIITALVICFLLCPIAASASDNADSGSGETGNALSSKGYYLSNEYMYKVSVYVGLSDISDVSGRLNKEFKALSNKPIYIKPNTFSVPKNMVCSDYNKAQYIKGYSISSTAFNSITVITDNPPPIPIACGGNINSVKSYFGDTHTLNTFIDAYAIQQNKTREELVDNIRFTISGQSGYYPAKDILPVKVNGKYQNKVPWLIIYEPVIISYLKPDRNGIRQVLAFTATEYALAQKLGYFDFGYGSNGQFIKAMTHSDLPNSVVLEYPWFGYDVTTPLADNIKWSDDRIIAGGGWGMRLLEANGEGVELNETERDYEYRVDTDVITSFTIRATNGDITPDKRHTTFDTRSSSYRNPTDNKSYVTITANGQSVTTPVVIPNGSSEYVWLKWRTPSTECDVSITVSISGNSSARLENGNRSATFTAKISDISENEPPDPKPHDKNNGFMIPRVPNTEENTHATWGVYSARWIADYQWREDWTRYHSGCHDEYKIDEDGSRVITGTCHHYEWIDEGWWLDKGHWEYTYKNYTASISGSIVFSPDNYAPTASDDTMKSGYGVDINVRGNINTNAPTSHYTQVQNIVTYFPEFNYQNYWRILERTGDYYSFKSNKYSTYNSRTHFTPLWYPDGKYEVHTKLLDVWTPDGMLKVNLNDEVNISGNMYEDWHGATRFLTNITL